MEVLVEVGGRWAHTTQGLTEIAISRAGAISMMAGWVTRLGDTFGVGVGLTISVPPIRAHPTFELSHARFTSSCLFSTDHEVDDGSRNCRVTVVSMSA